MSIRHPVAVRVCVVIAAIAAVARAEGPPAAAVEWERRDIRGWTVLVNRDLLADGAAEATERALELLAVQLEEIESEVPAEAVARLREVPLHVSPEYPGTPPRAEYHPDAAWLRDHGRDPAMARAVEFTNVRNFAEETVRMPNFVLHELAHAYHDRVLPDGFANAAIRRAYDRAVAGGGYDKVERWHGNRRPPSFERAYAMTMPQEYFAEASEAFFSRNDFFPFTREDLRRHDPEMAALVADLWGVRDEAAVPGVAGGRNRKSAKRQSSRR